LGLPAAAAGLERTLIQFLVALAVVLVSAQLLLTVPAARYVMSYVERLEGLPLQADVPCVTIVLAGGGPGEKAYLLLNGERVATFAGGRVDVAVAPGDLLQVDGRDLDGEGVFEVRAVRGPVAAPPVGATAVTRGGDASFGRVKMESPPGGG